MSFSCNSNSVQNLIATATELQSLTLFCRSPSKPTSQDGAQTTVKWQPCRSCTQLRGLHVAGTQPSGRDPGTPWGSRPSTSIAVPAKTRDTATKLVGLGRLINTLVNSDWERTIPPYLREKNVL